MIGRASAFLEILKSAVPGMVRILAADRSSSSELDLSNVEQAYAVLAPGDFSKQVLPASTERLAVLRLGNVGWSDLGTPERVMFAMARSGLRSHWLYAAQNEKSLAKISIS
jgi:hypothetical protein